MSRSQCGPKKFPPQLFLSTPFLDRRGNFFGTPGSLSRQRNVQVEPEWILVEALSRTLH
ncbi:hypothetical protein KSP40_PGU012732 [Platanthera guangdongensis]|uniref:Uncharacterized protein n=1 Tax=Platanthera guangdongensis TaxID=2320717 RepID=A0ABR2MQI2_9ASPA